MEFSRRSFLNLMLGAAAGEIAAKAIPLGRVWSFPSEIIIPRPTGNQFLNPEWVSMEILNLLKKNMMASDYFISDLCDLPGMGGKKLIRFPQYQA